MKRLSLSAPSVMPRRRTLFWPLLAGSLGIAIVALVWLGYL